MLYKILIIASTLNILFALWDFCSTYSENRKKIKEHKRRAQPLTPEYLMKLGWEIDANVLGKYNRRNWIEPNVKERDKIHIRFNADDNIGNITSYSVRHGKVRTYIATADSIGWFEDYYKLLNK